MNILFYGFRHGHILSCYRALQKHPEYTILAALEDDEAARLAAEANLGISFDLGSYSQWLEDPRVEAVAIGGAFGDRGAAIIQALRHGKHVLSDKPICSDLAQLEEIRALARKNRCKIGCLLDLRETPAVQRAKALFDSGRMGEVRNITFTGQHYLDYDHRPTWYYEPGKHGGTINDLAIHGVDLITYLTGHRIEQVQSARCWNAFAHRHPDFRDCATFMAETDQGAGVLADVSYSAPNLCFSMPTYWNFQIWCDRGLVTFCYANPDVTIYEAGASAPEILPGIPPAVTIADAFAAEIQLDTDRFTESVLAATESTLRIQQAADLQP